MEYQEDIARASISYRRLVRAGVFAYDLRGNYQRKGDDWQLRFSVLGDMDRGYAKRVAEVYLKDQYMASSIYFFQRSSDKDNQFRASFHRGDV